LFIHIFPIRKSNYQINQGNTIINFWILQSWNIQINYSFNLYDDSTLFLMKDTQEYYYYMNTQIGNEPMFFKSSLYIRAYYMTLIFLAFLLIGVVVFHYINIFKQKSSNRSVSGVLLRA